MIVNVVIFFYSKDEWMYLVLYLMSMVLVSVCNIYCDYRVGGKIGSVLDIVCVVVRIFWD